VKEKKKLEDTLATRIKDAICLIERTIGETVYLALRRGAQKGQQESLSMTKSWGSKQIRGRTENGQGLSWSTYLATVIRYGVYNSRSTGHIDFNQELSNPVEENIACSWNLALNLGIVSNLTQVEIKVKSDIHNANQTCKTVLLRFIHNYSRVTIVTQQAQDAALTRLFREMKLIKNFIRQRHMEISQSLVSQYQR
jgi:hypothetical protein